MLIGLGFVMIAVFMYLILSKRLTPVIALILVPVVFGIAAVQFGAAVLPEDGGVADSIMDAIKSFAPTAALLFFAIIYFGLMIDVGLFDPLIRFILRVVGNSPVRLVIGTAVLAGMVSLDGDGSTTFIITVSALLPIYLKLGMSPVVLTVVACLANGVLNIVPWGGPTVRAATVLKVSPNDLFIPMVPGMIAAMVAVLVLAYLMGRSEKKRLLTSGRTLETVAASLGSEQGATGGGDGGRRALGILPPRPGGSADLELDYEERQLRHGVRARPGTQNPSPEADLVQPRADRRPAGDARHGRLPAGPAVHDRCGDRAGGQLPRSPRPVRTGQGTRQFDRRRRGHGLRRRGAGRGAGGHRHGHCDGRGNRECCTAWSGSLVCGDHRPAEHAVHLLHEQ